MINPFKYVLVQVTLPRSMFQDTLFSLQSATNRKWQQGASSVVQITVGCFQSTYHVEAMIYILLHNV